MRYARVKTPNHSQHNYQPSNYISKNIMNSKTAQHYHNTLIRLSIVALFLLVFQLPIHADVFRSTSSYRVDPRPMEATQIAPTPQYQTYESTIYEPFAEDAPSQYTNAGSESGSSSGPSKISGRRNLAGGGDPGNQSQNSPVGDAWVMLLFAAAAAIVIALRKKQTA